MKTNTLLMGRIGTGKTHSLRTIVEAEVSLRVLALEPGIADVLGDIPCPALHWHEIAPLALSWSDVTSFIKKMNLLGVGKLADVSDPNRSKYTQFFEVFDTCQNFTCDRCGAELGCVDDWGASDCLAVDGLTALCNLCMRTLVGAKPFVSLPEYKAGQEAVMALVNMLLPLRCSVILLAHTDRELIHESGQVLETAHAIGNKLAPQLTKAFSEVIWAKREDSSRGPTFLWSTMEPGAESKGRRLPWSDRLRPDFRQLLS